ncbi:fungal-specific transcription factor domain-containing protein [Russula earlei]|uniref:Fungal-specific transcription factor domain-containing protein n=1 Tax=Russula earlei TaxID=71964 RepID=A0ACC0UH46_9AGAM|nr:fungal-specific transcription factor domain-containing protein [Russula earlei]
MDSPPDTAPADHQDDQQAKSSGKTPVVRGARACTVCRAAKMKCVGAEDGSQPCQRCRRTGVECVFERHRRGRKPGSKLSEASKMLRRLEKGLNNAKLKSQALEASSSMSPTDWRMRRGEPRTRSPGRYSSDLPRLNPPASYDGDERHDIKLRSATDEEENESEGKPDGMFPADLIRRENQRHSFFKTILNPSHENPATSLRSDRSNSSRSPPAASTSVPPTLRDPVAAGILDESNAKVLFDLIFLRLNPFVNLFDPALHTPDYVRFKSPFLFTVLIMAGCKFFKPESFKQCQKLAHEFAVRAFAEQWKSVEVVQAFACLTYWREPEDTRTWMYIGLACRMAVELGLNRYVSPPPPTETELQLRERRNRERTYLVLFVHDRSLSNQTGRQWMLPEDDLVRHSSSWHEEGGTPIRPEDVIVAAFVQLRRIAAETTDVFYLHKGVPGAAHTDVNKEVLLRNCNGKLTQWMDTWHNEMRRANGETFHMSFLSFFRLHVRLFLNSFGIQAAMSPSSRTSPSVQALSACYTSAKDNLQIVSHDFASMSMLRYGQDSITVMTAYSAVFLLKLLRSSKTLAELHEGATSEIHAIISKTADAYEEASHLSPACTSAAYHARFLRELVAQDSFRSQPKIWDDGQPRPHRRESTLSSSTTQVSPPPGMYPRAMLDDVQNTVHHPFSYPISPTSSSMPVPSQDQMHNPPRTSTPSDDLRYWNNMFRDLGFGEAVDQSYPPPQTLSSAPPPSHQSLPHHHSYGNGRVVSHHPPPYAYHHMHSNAPGYGL